jgi:HK97 family phage major capsid protein
MKFKETLLKKVTKLESRKADLKAKAAKSENVEELRAISAEIEKVDEEISDFKEQIAALEEDERAASTNAEFRSTPPANAVKHNGGMSTVGSFEQKNGNPDAKSEDRTASVEYRSAFMAYVQKGTAIPAEFRNGTAINTGDTGAAIPVTVMNEVINTVRKRYGNLYNKVRKMSVQGGVEIPVGALQATFKWINESTVSPRQKLGELGKVQFSYHTLEIRVSQTFLSSILTLSAFEATIAEAIAVAYLQAMDYGIVNGSGDGTMLGILNDPRVTNTITMTAADISDWTKWRKNFFAKLPLGYRSGEFIFPLGTVDAYLETMADANNNPIFRQSTGLEVNDGDARNPNGRFFGREISIVEPDIIADFDSASAGDVIGVYWQPEEYAINENFGFTMIRYRDEELNEIVNKALVVTDGKTLNPTGFYKIIKG